MSRIVAADVEALLDRTGPSAGTSTGPLTESLWEGLRGARLLVTGGTGFFGRWLLEAILAADRRFALGARVTLLTREPARFAAAAPALAATPALVTVAGDVRDFRLPAGDLTHVIHAATTSSTAVDPATMFDVCVSGTRHVLDLARERSATRFLLTSSGAVYGRQPPELPLLPEDFRGRPDQLDPRSAYAEGKRGAELLTSLAAGEGLGATIARGFAFVGPRLPLDVHFAIGNFIRDALAGGALRIGGDGTPLRSYLYAADMVEWLVTILLRGAPARAYNVGSEEALSIRQIADRVAGVAATTLPGGRRPEVIVARPPTPGAPAERYVPDCTRARGELGLVPATSLDEGIRRTMLHELERRSRGDATA